MSPVRFVAEVSSNHNGDLARALRFVDVAAECGAWGVKFQQFQIERLFAREALEFNPRLRARSAWELPAGFHGPLARRARERGLCYSSTPFDLDAVEVLEPWVDAFKVASYQVLWPTLLREVARTGKPVVLATGMASLEEVRAAVDCLGESGASSIELLHCVSLYPTPPRLANLAAIATLREAFDLPVGWSDHSASIDVVARAVRRFRASQVELHLDLDGAGAEFAGRHCWLPGALKSLVQECSVPRCEPATHLADGDGRKEPRPEETHERLWRSDPSDGLRPLLCERARIRGKRAA